MEHQLQLTEAPLDEAALLRARPPLTETGAVLTFAGVVRRLEAEQPIVAIDYEAYRDMVVHQFDHLFKTVEKRWPVQAVRLVHRVGRVRVGEASLWLEVRAPHRQDAFEASQWLIGEMKRRIPIWKRPQPAEP